jgi:hypothetical protein
MNIRVPKSPPSTDETSSSSVKDIETLLGEWFGANVVLTSSGRSAILLTLRTLGFSRYRSRVAVPRFIARCVIDAISNAAFPIDAAEHHTVGPDATLYFHQYGFPQSVKPDGILIEDIAHSFFGSPQTGKRHWAGDVAIFSLPKFFPTRSLLGGIITPDPDIAARLKRERDNATKKTRSVIEEEGRIFRECTLAPTDDLELMYLARLLNPTVQDVELGGLPRTMDELKNAGATRQAILRKLISAAGRLVPHGWSDMLLDRLPYALPIRGEQEVLARIHTAMRATGVASDMYQIDTARNMLSPMYETMLLIPYSHRVPGDVLEDMTAILEQS